MNTHPELKDSLSLNLLAGGNSMADAKPLAVRRSKTRYRYAIAALDVSRLGYSVRPLAAF